MSAEPEWFTPLDAIAPAVASVRKAFESGRARGLEFRRQQLRRLGLLLKTHQEELFAAVEKDLHKHRHETLSTELGLVLNELVEIEDDLESLFKPSGVSTPAVFKLDTCETRRDPLGVVLIIGAWNYPLQLTLLPLVGAIACGNGVVLKPSEVSVNTARLLGELLPRYLDRDLYVVVNGGVKETTELLTHRFDHILYTGNGVVARVVMAAAAKHLTPVTLELGGKSPAILAADCDATLAGRRVGWGRLINAGQTCVAPDYVLMNEKHCDAFVAGFKAAVTEFYGDNPKQSTSYCRIVSQRHFQRLKRLLDAAGAGKVVVGGEMDEKELYIAPTVLVQPDLQSPVMQEEIFGPILPIIFVKDVNESIDFVNARDKPLALYLFSNDSDITERVLTQTSSGAAVVNDTLVHATIPSLPFGGVGPSGMGSYHGKFSIDTFSHLKSVVVRSARFESVNAIRYPPYTDKKTGWLKWLAYKDIDVSGESVPHPHPAEPRRPHTTSNASNPN